MANITNGPWKGSTSDVTIAHAAMTTLADIPIRDGASALAVTISNGADKALTGFEVQYLAQSDAAGVAKFRTVASIDSDFTTAIKDPIFACTSDLTALPLSSGAFLWMGVKAVDRVRLRAQSTASSDTVMTAFWQVR